MNKDIIYLDSASTTKVDAIVLKEMLPYFSENFGNASSSHSFGQIAKEAIEKSRIQVANLINASPNEILFTSGATESINLALKGFVEANVDKGNHIITSKTEHKAVLSVCEHLETKGVELTYLDVDENGLISIQELQEAIKENTILISVMYVNNETGVIQPIQEIGAIAKKNNITFFSDATQAVGKVEVDVENDNIDMLCLSAHKLNGPKGAGILFKRKEIELTPLMHGGGQEVGMRAGTYNTPLIVGLGKACEIANLHFEERVRKLIERKTEIENYYEENNIGKLNFKSVKKAPHILSITLNDFEAGEYLMLKSKDFVASTGSACNAEIVEVSHVIKAIGIKFPEKIIRISI